MMNETLKYYINKLERTNRKIERLKPVLDEEQSLNEQTSLLIAEAEKRLLEEFIQDLKSLK